jgi:hypothetical protein
MRVKVKDPREARSRLKGLVVLTCWDFEGAKRANRKFSIRE